MLGLRECWNPTNSAAGVAIKTITEKSGTLGLQLNVVGARDAAEIESAFRTISQARAEALLIIPERTFLNHYGRIADLAMRYRLPTVCLDQWYAQTSGLMT